ncbi:phosphoribosylglycinamide formyltransferase [Haliea sp. E1-2-M8]|uniref:phosphoribosylglycinamide formyltransferase n=1 Tax=Haliea sp. E1-2-M8 TaxID=3064706 RepID=UPI0027292509|nr:phosphoribosylglycinamide formyltransferase [Haliea sp. E1-2-M8]MDO8862182.1 phosphoribosylglycinamide formyltransferase [Haliea sp. E1-2-M8]
MSVSRIAILISGRGSNMGTLLQACERGELPAQVCLVLSNRADAEGLDNARRAGIATACIAHGDYPDREAFDAALVRRLQQAQPDLVMLAGFMRILTPVFITPFAGRLLNIHPSLLPNYPGLHTHQRALDAGDSEAGSTVHFVTPELDGGPPVLQARVPILPGDTADSLARRVVALEHEIYPLAALWYLQGRLTLNQQGAFLDGQKIPPSGVPYRPQDAVRHDAADRSNQQRPC